MSPTAWPYDEPPFHVGERSVQRRAGVESRMAEIGPHVVRARMPDQHRAFFHQLPFIAVGAVDADGQPWASLVVGDAPGFVTSPEDDSLRVAARVPAADPIAALIRPGAALGVLGIELPTRRRNRANGRVESVDAAGFVMHVEQSFGNCPKYIQRREQRPRDGTPSASPARRSGRLEAAARALVQRADTFFIATHAAGDPGVEANDEANGGHNGGSDLSHRGGRPGFVRVSDDGSSLTWPDFIGNQFFDTLGNIALQPRIGLVFPDFENGDLLHVAGRAEIVWDGAELEGFTGAQRLVRVAVDAVLFRPAAVPLRWRLVDASPALAGTGVW